MLLKKLSTIQDNFDTLNNNIIHNVNRDDESLDKILSSSYKKLKSSKNEIKKSWYENILIYF